MKILLKLEYSIKIILFGKKQAFANKTNVLKHSISNVVLVLIAITNETHGRTHALVHYNKFNNICLM